MAPLRLLCPSAPRPGFRRRLGRDRDLSPRRASSPPGEEQTDFGDYELREVLGSGAMGIVYRAWQRSLGIFVALKVIRTGHLAASDEVRRFRDEAKKVAQLRHPHIVRVLNCSEHEGRHYFAMELMEGGSLKRQLELGPVPSRRAAQWLLEVAQAIEAAHQIGMIHRDLKPANVVLDGNAAAHVTDFGLARWLDQESSLTAPGAIVGTLGYMAPEQADGKATVAADIYGVGAILYALLAGRPPFHSETVLGTSNKSPPGTDCSAPHQFRSRFRSRTDLPEMSGEGAGAPLYERRRRRRGFGIVPRRRAPSPRPPAWLDGCIIPAL